MHLELKDETPLTIWSLWPLFMAFTAVFVAPILVYFYAKHDLKLVMIVFALNTLVVLSTVLSFSAKHEGKEKKGVLAIPTLIRAYWCRNVRGHEIWCYYEPEEKQSMTFYVDRRTSDAERRTKEHFLKSGVVIILPLGGWFNAPRILFSAKASHNHQYSDNWRVKLLSAEQESVSVSLQDCQGDCVRMDVRCALRIVTEHNGYSDNTLSYVMSHSHAGSSSEAIALTAKSNSN